MALTNALPVSGCLGAGKTAVVNRFRAEDHGLRLMVILVDFGAIDIDAALITGASDDTIALTKGCVYCTFGPELLIALANVRDPDACPDHLIIEASRIADTVGHGQRGDRRAGARLWQDHCHRRYCNCWTILPSPHRSRQPTSWP